MMQEKQAALDKERADAAVREREREGLCSRARIPFYFDLMLECFQGKLSYKSVTASSSEDSR